uniref:Capsid assembly protein n=1 Tax=viral metagenome TaxID=1070528 RepID=A0A6M3K6F4_9ZZZZ
MDNLDPVVDNQDPVEDTNTDDTTTTDIQAPISWKSNLQGDLGKSPLLNKFEDTPEGLNEAFKSHANLEKLLGHDKVPIPKGPEDVEGWSRFSKALGIPDKAENYGLADAKVPDSMKGLTFDKQKFAETVHAFKLTPAQAKGLWQAYTEQNVEAYNKALKSHKADMDKVVNQLKSEWGDAYDGNVELGQLVINKFSDDKETADYITAVLAKEPKAIKFLSKIGEQFAENKIGEFSYKRFSLSPEQAQSEVESILKDKKHPYNDPAAGQSEHDAAVDYVNNLYLTINKAKG